MTLASVNPDDQALVYHYTSEAGLIGILTSRSIWASDALLLNDASELRSGVAVLERQFEKARYALRNSTTTNLDARLAVVDYAEKRLRSITSGFDGPDQLFVASFCEDGDLLSQWRSYGRGDGYAIGFRRQQLGAATGWDIEYEEPGSVHRVQSGLAFGPIFYDESSFEAEVEKRLRFLENLTMPVGKGDYEGNSLNALHLLARKKHESFAHEFEWRLSFVRNGPGPAWIREGEKRPVIKFRPSTRALVPYICVRFGLEAIGEVKVGPGHGREDRVRGVRRLVEYGRFNSEVTTSELPYLA